MNPGDPNVQPAARLARGGRVSLAVNPHAGLGAARNLAIARELLQVLEPSQVITGPGALGGDATTDPVLVEIAVDSANATRQIAREAAHRQADVLVVVGGDGSMADAALELHRLGSQVPILGVGAGSTNAGALVSCQSDELQSLLSSELEVTNVTALQLMSPDGELVLAFNDVVVGTTICGTLDGEFANLDAAAFMRGDRLRGVPGSVASETARVSKVSLRGELKVASGLDVGSVVIGFANTGELKGQALFGGLGLSAGASVPAGCLVATAPLVYAGFDKERHASIEPLRSAYVGLDAGETIRLSGFTAGAILCADGNPIWNLQSADVAEIRLIQDACRAVRPTGGLT